MTGNNSTPIISRVLPDGTLIEALYDAGASSTFLAIRTSAGNKLVEPHFDLPSKERLIPYAPSNNLLTSGCVLLPSDIGEFDGKAALLADVRAYVRRYVQLSPLYEEIAAHYVLLSWVYDAFNETPYLRFQGEYGTGKTRALLAIGSICYKPFLASGASTVSPIFHVLDAFGGTLILDEADLRFSDATADLTKILNNGSMRGLPVLRTMTNRHRELNPQAFKVYGPKVVAMRHGFADDALESRFLTERTAKQALRDDIALSTPDAMAVDALALRNKLLAWRFAERDRVAIDPALAFASLSPRGNQMALPLLSIVDDEALREQIAGDLVAGEARVATIRAADPTTTMVRIVSKLLTECAKPYVPISELVAAYNDDVKTRGENPLSPKAAGSIVRKLGLITAKSRGVYVIPEGERRKLDHLRLRYSVTLNQPPIANSMCLDLRAKREKYAVIA